MYLNLYFCPHDRCILCIAWTMLSKDLSVRPSVCRTLHCVTTAKHTESFQFPRNETRFPTPSLSTQAPTNLFLIHPADGVTAAFFHVSVKKTGCFYSPNITYVTLRYATVGYCYNHSRKILCIAVTLETANPGFKLAPAFTDHELVLN